MIKTSLLFWGTLSILAQDAKRMPPFGPPGLLGNQQGYFHIDSFGSSGGLSVRFHAVVDPPLANPQDLKLGWGVIRRQADGKNVWHRFVTDKVNQQYFGYDLVVDPGQNPSQYRITFSPLSIGSDQLQPSGLSPVPLPKYPEPQTIMPGDTIAVDLLISPDGKRKIVDYIEFSPGSPADPPPATSTGEPRDYTLDDGPLKFDFVGFVSINGQKFQGQTGFFRGKHGGATLWFSFPGQGRYILSLAPHDGFSKMGTVRDHVVSFQANGQRYEIRMGSPVVGNGGAWNLYGFYDPSYKTENNEQTAIPGSIPPGTIMVVGGTDRLESLLPK